MKGYKTIIFNAVSFAAVVLGWAPLSQYVDPQWITAGIAIVNGILRVITTTPIFNPASDA